MELRFCDIFQARFLYVQTALLFTNTIIPYKTLTVQVDLVLHTYKSDTGFTNLAEFSGDITSHASAAAVFDRHHLLYQMLNLLNWYTPGTGRRLTSTFNLSTQAAMTWIKQTAFAERSCLSFPETGIDPYLRHLRELILQKIKLMLVLSEKQQGKHEGERWLRTARTGEGMEKPGPFHGSLPSDQCEIKGYTHTVSATK